MSARPCRTFLWVLVFVTAFTRCSSEEHSLSFADVTGPADYVWPHRKLHCNLVFVKVPKCASSTVAGITRRIARFRNLQGYDSAHPENKNYSHCSVAANHGHHDILISNVPKYGNKSTTFTFTFLRLPYRRLMSAYYHFRVTRDGASTADDKVLANLQQASNRTYLDYLGLHRSTLANTVDFVGIVERMEESLVVLQLLMGVTTHDILFTAAKNSSAQGKDPTTNISFVPARYTPAITDFINQHSKDKDANHAIYDWANRTLTRTIKKLGQDFTDAYKKFQKEQREANAKCASGIVSPNNCIWKDNGCDYKCLETFRDSKE